MIERTRDDDPARQGAPGAEPTHSADGVDLTLIRWMLSLTPAERLGVLEGFVNSLQSVRGPSEA
jgi:hypothetical protein